MESPEAHFEDFGVSQLARGFKTVDLDPEFADIIHRNNYHVYLTPYGESNGLYGSRRGDDSFDVTEQGNGTSSIKFAYRVVAPRLDGNTNTKANRVRRTRRPDLKGVNPNVKIEDLQRGR